MPDRKILLSADTPCDIGPELKERYQVSLFPLHIILDEKQYTDGLDITAADLNLAEGSAAAKLFGWADSIVFWVDNSLYSTVVGDFYNLLPLVLAGKMTPAEFAADLDSKVVK